MSWPVVKLGEVAEIEMGQAPAGDSYNDEGKGLPLIAGASDFGVLFPATSRFTSAPSKITRPNDIIMCIRATIGDLNLANGVYCLGRGVCGLRPRNDRIDARFLWRVLEASAEVMRSKGRGATFLQVSKSDIASLEIPLPPLAEQKRIAAILDQAARLTHLRAEALARLDTLGQAIFHEMFGEFSTDSGSWPTGRLGDFVVSAKIGLVRGAAEQGEDRSTRYLRMDAIGLDGSLSYTNLRKVDASEEERQTFSIRKGDFLFNTRNSRELVGKSAVAPADFDGVYNNNILRLRFSDGLNGSFLAAFLRTQFGKSALENLKSGTTNVFAIYQKALMELVTPLPPVEAQAQFATRLDAMQDQKTILVAANHKAQTLFSSLQHRAFRGEL